MNQSERDILGKALTSIAFLYGYELPREKVTMFISSLIDFVPATLNEYLTSLKKYSEDPKNRTFPNPAQLRQYLRPELSNDSKALEAANRIREGIVKFGFWRLEEAKTFIGDVGWAVVQRCGGWQYVCENHGVDLNPLTFHAQARDTAKSILEMESLGVLGQPIMLEEKRANGLIGSGDVVKNLLNGRQFTSSPSLTPVNNSEDKQ